MKTTKTTDIDERDMICEKCGDNTMYSDPNTNDEPTCQVCNEYYGEAITPGPNPTFTSYDAAKADAINYD